MTVVTQAPDADNPPEQVSLPADATAAGIARAQVRRVVLGWGLPSVIEPLTLIVSELVGNAVRYGRPPLALLVRRVGRGVRVDVHDELPGKEPAPSATPPNDQNAEGGRGLFLVKALSDDTGVEQISHDGKRVWAIVEADEK
jgi:anti-sigma regulatory factor (Ser/Thr protein kinase)